MKMALGSKQEPLFFSTDFEASETNNNIISIIVVYSCIEGDLVRERIAFLERNNNYKFSFEPRESMAQVYPGQVTMHA